MMNVKISRIIRYIINVNKLKFEMNVHITTPNIMPMGLP